MPQANFPIGIQEVLQLSIQPQSVHWLTEAMIEFKQKSI